MDKEARDAALRTLRMLEEQRTKTDAAIQVLRSLLEMPDAAQLPLTPVGINGNGHAAPTSLLSAAIDYLRAVGKPQTTPQVAAGLRGMGYQTTSKKFTNTVYARLYTAHKEGHADVERNPAGAWALREWRERRTAL
jgi:hypothetical protein